ncbi:PLDc N-terminal domain-containing protein [Paenibacillus tarimensis]
MGMWIGAFILIVICLFLLNILTSVWAYRDALSKGKSREFALLVLVGTLVFPVIGLIVYLIIRND